MYVWMDVWMYACMYVRTYVHTYVYSHPADIYSHPAIDTIWTFQKTLTKMGICLNIPYSIDFRIMIYVYIYTYPQI